VQRVGGRVRQRESRRHAGWHESYKRNSPASEHEPFRKPIYLHRERCRDTHVRLELSDTMG
jgi:hypothetical protein